MTEARVPVTVEDREAGQRLLDRLHEMLRRQGAEVDDTTVTDDGEIAQALARHRLAGVAVGREEASAAIREVRLAEAAYAEGRAGAVDRLDAALKALFAYEGPAVRQMGEW